MSSDAQKLISLSLTKIAQSRSQRKGLSLHKNLLVATVLQKARYIFMEEAYNMIHGPVQSACDLSLPVPEPTENSSSLNDEVDLIALTEEEKDSSSDSDFLSSSSDSNSAPVPSLSLSVSSSSRSNCTVDDKENVKPSAYLDLETVTDNTVQKESTSPSKSNNLKRRRLIAEWETEEAVLSILPKKHKSTSNLDSSVFLDDSPLLNEEESEEESAMDIDRITSLVSIFSFGGLGAPQSSTDSSKLVRSSSTPDFCSAQVKDQHELQQRHFLAMTV